MTHHNSKILFCLFCLFFATLSDEDSCDAKSGTCKNGDLVEHDVGNAWFDCFSMLRCAPTAVQDASQVELEAIKAYESSLQSDPESKAIAKKGWSDCSSAQTQVMELDELLRNRGGAKEMRDKMEKLEGLRSSLGESATKLHLLLEEAHAKRKDLLQSIHKLKDENSNALFSRAQTWTQKGLMHKNDVARQAYPLALGAHEELDRVEKDVVDSIRKVYDALEPDSTLKTTVVEAQARSLVKNALPLLQDASWWQFQKAASIVQNLETYERRRMAAFEKAQKYTAAGKDTSASPIVTTNNEISKNFLDVVVRNAFPQVPDSHYTLSSYLGGSGNDTFLCLRVVSNILKDDTVCGCYRSKRDRGIVHYLVEQGQLPEDSNIATSCNRMIVASTRGPVDIGSSSLTPCTSYEAREAELRPMSLASSSTSTPLRICMVTWNVGSEKEVPLSGGAGLGWGGVDGKEFDRDFRRLLQEGCTHEDNDVVVFALQEASDPKSRDTIDKAVFGVFGNWHVHHVYAGAVDFLSTEEAKKGYGGLDYLHELGALTESKPGVHLIVISRNKPKEVRGFGTISKARSKELLYWLGDKGTALAQVKLVHDDEERTICFAGSHFDAGKEEKRKIQTANTQEAFKVIGCPDGAWWGGDFNPRLEVEKGVSQHCCPWAKMEFLMHHGGKDALVELARRIDPISQGYSWRKDTEGATEIAPFTMKDWHCKGEQCSAGWHEFPIGFAPTFHKLYHRQARRNEEGTCDFTYRDIPKVDVYGPQGLLSLDDLLLLNHARFEIKLEKDDKCPGSDHRVEMCWDAEYNFDGCAKRGYCHHVHHADHCPGYTDRILHAFNIRKEGADFRELAAHSEFPIVVGGRYEALASITTADHVPVLAQFTVRYS